MMSRAWAGQEGKEHSPVTTDVKLRNDYHTAPNGHDLALEAAECQVVNDDN